MKCEGTCGKLMDMQGYMEVIPLLRYHDNHVCILFSFDIPYNHTYIHTYIAKKQKTQNKTLLLDVNLIFTLILHSLLLMQVCKSIG